MGLSLRWPALLACFWASTLSATTFQSTVANGLPDGSGLAVAPDGRVFVLQRTGQVRLVENGSLVNTPLLDLTSIAGFTAQGLEKGVIGIALDPDFGNNGQVYLHYTVELPGGLVTNRISRFTMVGTTIQPVTEQLLIELEANNTNAHLGGGMTFGADGKLYVSVGDRALPSSAADPTDTWGSVLRLNSNGTFAGGDLFPTDNPFFTTQSAKGSAVFVQGLRNPFGLAVQPGTGLMFINDAGEQTWEEINAVAFGNPVGAAPGANFGWPACEGNFEYVAPPLGHSNVTPCGALGVTAPLLAYSSAGSGNCAITGGTFFDGGYLFADYCSGLIQRYDLATQTLDPVPFYAATGFGPTALAVKADGMGVYYLDSRYGTLGLLTTVPEPATWTLAALILLLLLLRQARLQFRPARVKLLHFRLGRR